MYQEKARAELQSRSMEFLEDLRNDLYSSIDELRAEIYNENEVVRPVIQDAIARTADVIDTHRSVGGAFEVDDFLVSYIRDLNKIRHDNRELVKELSDQQATNKAMLAEVNRAISVYSKVLARG